MRITLTFLFLLCINTSFSQLISGDIVSVGRRLLTPSTFTINGAKKGEIVYEISVDIYGNVTSSTLVQSMTDVVSTPLKMDAKNLINTLKFEKGNGYPKFHHAKVKITVVDKKEL